jgi:hypothetical protein
MCPAFKAWPSIHLPLSSVSRLRVVETVKMPMVTDRGAFFLCVCVLMFPFWSLHPSGGHFQDFPEAKGMQKTKLS